MFKPVVTGVVLISDTWAPSRVLELTAEQRPKAVPTLVADEGAIERF
jgi:hypothetical protein